MPVVLNAFYNGVDVNIFDHLVNISKIMKYGVFLMACCTAISFASTVSAAPCDSNSCDSGQKGVRQYAALGTKNWAKRVLDKPRKGWYTTEWNKRMAAVVDKAQSCAFDQHYPTLVAKFNWSDAYVDERIKPNRDQARDPNWSNYVWNQRETSSDFVYDGISDALNSSMVDNGRGKAKLAISIGLSATSDKLIPPLWMTSDSSLAWLEGKNSNGKSDNWHVRFDNARAVEHASDFLQAFLAKYGDNKGLHSVLLGEYYLGQRQYFPKGLNRGRYFSGVKTLWENVVKAAPRDGNGDRIDIVQTNPIFSSNVTASDLESLGMGISESDTNLDFPVSKNPVTAAMRELYDNRKVHVMIEGDARYACQGRRQTWDGTANPFGHKKGYSGVATPQEVLWYHGNKGPAPVHSLFMTIAPWCSGPQNRANFIDAIEKFGRCGSETSQWGAAPAILNGKINGGGGEVVDSSKPNPPEIAVN